ncbi:cytochrome c nitrite reductase small subunit [Anatilimnocola sp. NA78]|uniref:cytochrome c nitrite reductase small subunit n=1 Tax=Anatilimnocola sp. NA78 TaxID=3415683 RepID=UPI003CE4D926
MDSNTPAREPWFARLRAASWRGMTLLGIITAVLVGVALGQSAYTFRYAEGLSYLSADPKACVNCHIMQPQYDGWQKASHHTVAKCVDCHLPHDFLGKYYTKAENGFWHSKGFTLQDFHEPIVMRPVSRRILQDNCLHCHADFVHDVLSVRDGQEELDCVHCHRGVGHGDSVGMGRYEALSFEERKKWGPHVQSP